MAHWTSGGVWKNTAIDTITSANLLEETVWDVCIVTVCGHDRSKAKAGTDLKSDAVWSVVACEVAGREARTCTDVN